MKYVFLLIILSMLAFCILTFPVFNITANEIYLVCPDDFISDRTLKNSVKWQTNDYFVYKLDKSEVYKARFIPEGRIIKEYVFENDNTFKRNPLLQSVFSGGQSVIGLPYVID